MLNRIFDFLAGYLFGLIAGLVLMISTAFFLLIGQKMTGFFVLILGSTVVGCACALSSGSFLARLGFCVGTYCSLYGTMGQNPGKAAVAGVLVGMIITPLYRRVFQQPASAKDSR